MKKYKIAVAGTGYVGLSIATLLSQHHHVTAVDILPEKVALINARKSPIRDDYIEKYLAEKELDLTATLDAKAAYADADFVVIAAPTNYDSQTQHFDTSAVEAVIRLVTEVNPNAVMVIKSTIPVGYTVSGKSNGMIFSYSTTRIPIHGSGSKCTSCNIISNAASGYRETPSGSNRDSTETTIQKSLWGMWKVKRTYPDKKRIGCRTVSTVVSLLILHSIGMFMISVLCISPEKGIELP